MRTLIAYFFGLLGFLLQGGAVIGLPAYVIFLGGSSWWLMAILPLGFAGMIPFGLMFSMLKINERESLTKGPNEPMSQALAAFYEIQSRDEVPGWSSVNDKVLELLNDSGKTVASIREDGLDPNALVHLLVTNVANSKLCSGENHVYRGTLSAAGDAVLSAFVYSSNMLVQYGVQNKEKHRSDVESLKHEMKSIG